MGTMKALQDRISSVFYNHGLFCASHPYAIISAVILIQIITCWPLLNMPLPGNAPLQWRTAASDTAPPLPSDPPHASKPAASSPQKAPRWYIGPPVAYVQQLVLKLAVSPWQPRKLIPTDAFRTPLETAFDMLEQIQAFQYKEGGKSYSVSDVCLHVSEGVRGREAVAGWAGFKGVLPEYNCLLLSPANFWSQDRYKFREDADFLKTVFDTFGQKLNNPPTVRDLLFGLSRTDTGLNKYFMRNRQRVVSYAVTLVFKDYNPNFISALRDKFTSLYPLSAGSLSENVTASEQLVHLHFKDMHYIVEYTPLLVTYAVLFLYIYFSVCKIEMVKSKWGLALSAVVTVIASLLMSVSICLLFGLTPSLNGSEIFPYLVVIIGLENVLVVTKSVVSTPVHLPVKQRVARGLSKEGWFMFRHVMTELTILAVGFLTFVPPIQEFCVFALVGLMSDLYLQMYFFTSVLSIDIRRMELSDLHKQSVQQSLQDNPSVAASATASAAHPYMTSTGQCPLLRRLGGTEVPDRHLYVAPPPGDEAGGGAAGGGGSGGLTPGGGYPQRTPALFPPSHPVVVKVPRRVQFLNFWASTRVVQRLLMACLVWWIVMFVYKAGIVEHMLPSTAHNPPRLNLAEIQKDEGKHREWLQRTLLHHDELDPWKHLSYLHWPTVFGYYNISLYGHYISMLPAIPLSIAITPETAILQRHPVEESRYYAQQPTADSYLSAAYDNEPFPTATDESESESVPVTVTTTTFHSNQSLSLLLLVQRLTHYPRNRTELAASIFLGVCSVILFAYGMVILYKCICPRNYSKWRSNWGKSGGKGRHKKQSPYYKQIRESVPLVLSGHIQEVECLVTDGPVVVSSCLGGQLCVWDSNSGECVTAINRTGRVAPVSRKPIPGRNMDDSDADLYAEYHGAADPLFASSTAAPSTSPSPPPLTSRPRNRSHTRCQSYGSVFDFMPDLSETIDTNFSSQINSSYVRSNSLAGSRKGSCGDFANYRGGKVLQQQSSVSSQVPTSVPASSVSVSVCVSPTGPMTVSTTSVYTVEQSGAPSTVSGTGTVLHLNQNSTVPPSPTSTVHSPVFSSAVLTTSSAVHPPPSPNYVGCTSVSSPAVPGSSVPPPPSPHPYTAVSTVPSPVSPTTLSSTTNPSSPHFTLAPATTTPSPTTLTPTLPPVTAPYDFSAFASLYNEHAELLIAKTQTYIERRRNTNMRRRMNANTARLPRPHSDSWADETGAGGGGNYGGMGYYDGGGGGDHQALGDGSSGGQYYSSGEDIPGSVSGDGDSCSSGPANPIWCLACQDNLIVAGCGNGKIEFWDGLTGQQKYLYSSDSNSGVTAVCFIANKVIAARLNGTLDFLELETFVNINRSSAASSAVHKRGHFRKLSNHGVVSDMKAWDDTIRCTLHTSVRAHQRPIDHLQSEGGRVVTASQDHTLKVFRLEDSLCLYTLHGHSGNISALFLDKGAPLAAASGSEDGTVRLWDLLTGNCVHKLHRHVGSVTCLTMSQQHVISAGSDDRLTIWDRLTGQLRRWIQMEAGFCHCLSMLTSRLLVTGGSQGMLYLWDVQRGEVLRSVALGDSAGSSSIHPLATSTYSSASGVCVRNLRVIQNSTVVCDYGNQLRVIHFPAVLEKAD